MRQVALGAGNAVADLRAMAAPTTPAAEAAENFQRAAGYVPPGPGTEVDADPVVEQGDGFYWMNRARRAEGRLRQLSALVAATNKRVRKMDDLMRNWRDPDEEA